MSAYIDALNGHGSVSPPRLVADQRRRLQENSRISRIEKLTSPIRPSEQAAVRAAFRRFSQSLQAQLPRLSQRYFSITEITTLRGGIGSADTHRYLVRVQGETADPVDDEFIELKPLSKRPKAVCLSSTPHSAKEISTSEELISDPADRFVAQLEIRGTPYWAHAWPHEYWEFRLKAGVAFKDMREVAEAVGSRLGLAHRRWLQSDRDIALATANTRKLVPICKQLARLTIEAWSELRERRGVSRG